MELVTALLLPILLAELYTWLPAISEWVLEFNVRRLCVENREQFRAEWKANLDAFPNTIVKLIHALSYTVAALRINKELFDNNFATIGQKLRYSQNRYLRFPKTQKEHSKNQPNY
jgi:hypothetical protein